MVKVKADDIRNAIGIIGNITSFFLFASPVPVIWNIYQEGRVGDFKFHTIVAGIMNCLMWVFYSMPFVHPHSILVTTINSIGLVMYIIYNIVYLVFSDNKKRKLMVLFYVGEIVFLSAFICITILVFHTHTSRSIFVGVFCDVFVVLLYASPLTAMYNVITTKSVKYMPLSLSLAGFLNGIVWSIYAIIRLDLFILIGNIIGVVLRAMQLILYACYCRNTPEEENKKVSGPKISVSLEL